MQLICFWEIHVTSAWLVKWVTAIRPVSTACRVAAHCNQPSSPHPTFKSYQQLCCVMSLQIPQTVARPWCSVLPVTHRAIPQSCRVLPQTLPSSAVSTPVWNPVEERTQLTHLAPMHSAVRCFEKDDFISSPFSLWNVLTFPLHLCKTSVYKRY